MFNRVLRNIIDVGLPTDIPALDNAEVKYEGIAIRAGTGFEISENDITGHILNEGKVTNDDLPYSVGISVIATLSANEEVYRNYMHGLNWAFVANGNNNSDEDNAGLRYVCNENDGNNYDFVVGDEGDEPESSQIGETQADYPNPDEETEDILATGNKFSQGNSNDFNDFLNETQTGGIEYWYFEGNLTENLEEYNEYVLPEPEASENNCFSEINLLDNSNRPNWLVARDEYRLAWLNTRFIWKTLIDNGNTEELKEQVENTFGTDTWTERDNLLSISPYVSRVVLEAVANNTTLFPHPVALEIFLANPDVLNDHLFIYLLMNKIDPMPEYMIDILMNAADQTTIRTILEDEMRDNQSRYLDAAQKLLRFDQDELDYEERMIELAAMRNLPVTYAIMDDLLSSGHFLEADSIYSETPHLVGLGRQTLPDFESYYQWFDIEQRIATSNLEYDNLPLVILNDLEILALDYPAHYIGQKAAALLNFYYDYDFIREVSVPENMPVPKRARLKKSESQQGISVYPSPAGALANVKLKIQDPRYLNEILEIKNILGEIIYSQPIKHLDQQWAIDTQNWKSGLYLISVSSQNLKVITTKLEIVH